MDSSALQLCSNLVPASYLMLGDDALKSVSNVIKDLLDHQKIPADGLDENIIEALLNQLSWLDSNNSLAVCGAGEREGRVFSKLVARRHFHLAHGVGRSGDVTAVQPKAAGSSIMNQLCTKLMLHIIQESGVRSAKSCIIVPMATGMTLMLTFLTLRSLRPKAKYIIWPRIDQKSCFKSMISAGFIPLIVENKLEGDELRTDVEGIKNQIERVGVDAVLCIHTTTSCFAPRVPDRLEEVAKLCKEQNIPHIVNNAYGLQLSKCTHLLEQSARVGRVDAFVQSCDKNLMVPVGGAILASFDKPTKDDFLTKIAATYAGRASATPAIDLLITALQLGVNGWKDLLRKRKANFLYLKEELKKIAEKHGEKVLETPHNPVSMVMTLSTLVGSNEDQKNHVTELGSMLFTRKVSGARVVPIGAKKTIENFNFLGFGSHCNSYPYPYITVAAAVGMTQDECDVIVKRIDKSFTDLKKRLSRVIRDEVSESSSCKDAP